MKVLVTGGAGFIGSHVVRELLAAGYTVRILHLPQENLRNLDGLDVEKLSGDITDSVSCRRAVDGCDWVFHLAAIYALWLRHPGQMRRVNVEGTRTLLAAATDAGVQKVVYTSSVAVFAGQGPSTDATEESSFALGQSGDLYSITKYESHQVALAFADAGLNLSIAAPCGPIGPGDIGPTPTGRFLLSAVNDPLPIVVNSASNFVDVRDVARGHLLVAQKGRRGESYLLGNCNLSIREAFERALHIAGLHKRVLCLPTSALMPLAYAWLWISDHVTQRAPRITPAGLRAARAGLRADCSKAQKELGFAPGDIDTAIRDALVWFAEHGKIRDPAVRARLLKG